jgi:putative ABC transport system ATP-binding protein
MALLKVNHLKKVYQTRFGGNKVEALRDVHFEVEEGEYIAIMGESGSGKSTLLNILATLDVATEGSVELNDLNMSQIPERQLAEYRRDHLGFIFQDFNLLDTFSVKDNIFLPLVLAKHTVGDMEKRIVPIAKKLGIIGLLNKYPYEISGGEKQRVAMARAIITDPDLILADEPTGALDSKNAEDILHIFEEINKLGQTIVMVTHSALAASKSNRVLFIKDGKVFHQLYRANQTSSEFLVQINQAMTNLLGRGE